MIFEQQERSHVIVIVDNDAKEMPAPEVGKVYKAFDDGKIRLSRLDYWRIDKAIDLDNDNVDPSLLEYIQKEINQCFWLYNKEQHIIYKATMVEKDGTDYFFEGGDEPTECYFLRTQDKGWFGTGFLVAGLLDVDERYYNELVEYTDD